MDNTRVKVKIQLTDEQMEGYPVSTESLWFDDEGDKYRLRNIPFFIDNISFGDLITLLPISADLYQIEDILERSGNSTVWISISADGDESEILGQIKELGCGVEGGVLAGYFAINVPKDVEITRLYSLIDDVAYKDVLTAHVASLGHSGVDPATLH